MIALVVAVTLGFIVLGFEIKRSRSPRLDDHTRPGYPAEHRNQRKG